MLLKVNTKSLCLQSRFAVKWALNTDRGFKAASWTLQNKKKSCTVLLRNLIKMFETRVKPREIKRLQKPSAKIQAFALA